MEELPDLSFVFTDDGWLRDIYVFDTNLADWSSAISVVTMCYEHDMWHDGQRLGMPYDVVTMLTETDRSWANLDLHAGKVTVKCHFFHAGEIEFDIDPREVKSSAERKDVTSFMRFLGKAVSKPVHLTGENQREVPYLTYNPDTDAYLIHEPPAA